MRLILNLIWLIFGRRDIVDVDQARRLGYAPEVTVPAGRS
jgi:hypothetical protein